MPPDPTPNEELLGHREALDHAWSWFELHASQRLQLVGFFFVAAAFLTSAYVAALTDGLNLLAAVVALVAAGASGAFNLLEIRTKRLVKAGERALRRAEDALRLGTGSDEIALLDLVEEPDSRIKYSLVINLFQRGGVALFLFMCLFALLSDSDGDPPPAPVEVRVVIDDRRAVVEDRSTTTSRPGSEPATPDTTTPVEVSTTEVTIKGSTTTTPPLVRPGS